MSALLRSGDQVGPYRIQGLLGRGATAIIYKVLNEEKGTYHALKVLSTSDASLKERMEREGRLQAKLNHPNIVRVTSKLDVDGNLALVMELVNGPTLSKWLADYTPTHEEALGVFMGILGAMHAAHRNNVAHRDLKPANILMALSEDGVRPKVMDFGLVKRVLGQGEEEEGPALTQVGTVLGTPRYMAPEQIADASAVDHRADLYAMGCILYELFHAQPAFAGDRPLEVLSKVMRGEYSPIDPDVPEDVRIAIERLLEVDPDMRMNTCLDLLAHLGLPADGRPVKVAADGRRLFFHEAQTVVAPAPDSTSQRRRVKKTAAADNEATVSTARIGMFVAGGAGLGLIIVGVIVLILAVVLLVLASMG